MRFDDDAPHGGADGCAPARVCARGDRKSSRRDGGWLWVAADERTDLSCPGSVARVTVSDSSSRRFMARVRPTDASVSLTIAPVRLIDASESPTIAAARLTDALESLSDPMNAETSAEVIGSRSSRKVTWLDG